MKIGFFITARLKSTRLKRKILLDMHGKPVLDRIIERAKKVQGIEGVVLCTSTNKQDSELYDYALKNQIQFYPGSEDDVLKRLLDAAKYYGYDAFVSITADNPLFSIYTSSKFVEMYKAESFDFIYTKGLPVGCGTYFLDVKALEVVDYIKKQSDTEIWGPFINRPDFFNIGMLDVNNPLDESLRLTLDYPEDYEILKTIYNQFSEDVIPSIFDVVEVLKNNNEILKINSNRKQIALDKEIIDKIDAEFNANKEKAIEYANQINKKLRSNFVKYNIDL